MSDVNSLFKKKKGKSKKLDLSAATAPKKPSKTKAEKKKEAAEDDEWKTETKKAVVLTSGKAVEEFGYCTIVLYCLNNKVLTCPFHICRSPQQQEVH